MRGGCGAGEEVEVEVGEEECFRRRRRLRFRHCRRHSLALLLPLDSAQGLALPRETCAKDSLARGEPRRRACWRAPSAEAC